MQQAIEVDNNNFRRALQSLDKPLWSNYLIYLEKIYQFVSLFIKVFIIVVLMIDAIMKNKQT
jgi:hypothetical protein